MKPWQLRKLFHKVLVVLLCLAFLAQSSPLLAMSYEKRELATANQAKAIAARKVEQQGAQPLAALSANIVRVKPFVSTAPQPTSLQETAATWPEMRPIFTAKGAPIAANVTQTPSWSVDEAALLSGWNLVSLPKIPADSDPSAVLSGILGQTEVVFAYDGCQPDPWKVFDPVAPPATNDLTAIDQTKGFWLEANAATTLPFGGTLPPTTTIELCTGWNLIAMPAGQARPVRNALFSIDGKYSRVFGYEPEDSADPWTIYDTTAPDWANDLQMMEPGRGYWVLATENTTMTLANEGAPPIARLLSPDELATEITSINFITDVIGTAYSGLLESWTLSYRAEGDVNWSAFATGNTPVLTDTLDQFNPTLLFNDLYEIKLETADYEGNIAIATADIFVEGAAKVGHFTLPILDLEIPLLGVPIQVIRTYDSRDKEIGDFGVGWQLSMNEIRLVESIAPGDGWESTLGGISENPFLPFFDYCLPPYLPHIVAIIMPDGTSYKFRPTVHPECQLLIPHTIVDITYEPMPGTVGTLEPLDQSGQNLLVVGGNPAPPLDLGDGPLGSFEPVPNQFWNQDIVDLHDPELYKLTLPNGNEFIIDQSNGIQSITDSNGNKVTFSQNEINHSSGVGLTFERDNLGRITKITDPLSNTIRYIYDNNGDLFQVIDQNDLTTTYTYVDNHYLDTIIDPDGTEVAALEFDVAGRVTSACNGDNNCVNRFYNPDSNQQITTDPVGQPTTYTYDDWGNVTAVKDALGQITTFQYDDHNNLIQETDPNGMTVRYAYDSYKNRIAETAPFDLALATQVFTTTYAYDHKNQLLSITQPTGAETLFSYDTKGNLLDIRDDEGNLITAYTYDNSGRILTESDPFGTVTYSNFDALGNPQTVVDAFGNETAIDYDVLGRPISMTHNGVTDIFSYDARGRLLTENFEGGPPTTYEYDTQSSESDWIASTTETGRIERLITDNGQLEGWVLPDGSLVSYDYNAVGQLISEVDPFGNLTEYTHNAIGLVDSIESPLLGGRVTIAYDAGGRVISQTSGLGTEYFTYAADGFLSSSTNTLGHTWLYTRSLTSTTTTDPLGRTTTTIFSPDGLPIQQINPDGSTFNVEYLVSNAALEPGDYPTRIIDEGGNLRLYEYDQFGRLISSTDLAGITYTLQYSGDDFIGFINPLGEAISFTEDIDGFLTSVTYPDDGTRQIEYDFIGNPITITQPSGIVIGVTYDEFGQPSTYSDSEGYFYSLDWIGNTEMLSTTVDETGTTEYFYDNLGQLVEIDYPSNANITYGYDAFGRVVTVTTQVSNTAPIYSTFYTYDAIGNLIEITDPLGGLTIREYDEVSRLITQTLPNEVTSVYTYNDLNQVTSLIHRDAEGDLIASLEYERIGIGEPTRITQADNSYVLLGYDEALRLESEAYYDASDTLLEVISYTYDLAGNRTSHNNNLGTYTYDYDPGYQLVNISGPSGSEIFAYDTNGRTTQITRDGTTHSFDYNSRDLLTTVENTTSGSVISYTYDALGNRVKATDGASTRQFLVAPVLGQGLASPHAVFDENGQLITNYVYAGEIPLMRFGPSGPIYYLPNAQGSIVALTNNLGEGVAHFQYDGFGNIRASTGSAQEIPQDVGGDFRFQGGWLEAGTGYYHLRAREYDPETGRFLSRDSADPNYRQPETAHTYAFALSNPYIYRDPTGRFTIMELQVTNAVGASIRKISAQTAIRYVLRKAKQEAGELAADLLIDFLTSWLPIDGVIGKILNTTGASDAGEAFSLSAARMVCNVVRFSGNERLLSYFYFEVKVEPNTGKPESNGLTCNDDFDTNTHLLGRQLPRPDFLLTPVPPLRLTGNLRKSFVIGDFKLQVRTARRKWGPNDGQWRAMVNHAKNYQYVNIILLLTWRGSKDQRTLRSLARLAKRHGVRLFVITMD